MKNMYNTVEKRRNLYNGYLCLKDENLELNKIAKELKISEEVLNHIISEFETGAAFPKHYTERLVLQLGQWGESENHIYLNEYGVFIWRDEEFSSLSEIFSKHNMYLPETVPTICENEFLPELRRVVEWDIRERGLRGGWELIKYALYKALGGLEFSPEFFESIDSQKNGLHDTEEKRKELYNTYLRLKSENLELNEIAVELRTSEEILNYIISEFEEGMIFPIHYTERLVFKLGTGDDRVLVYQDRYGVFKYKDEEYFSFFNVFFHNDVDLQWGKPTLYAKELKEELRKVIEWELNDRGVKGEFRHYRRDWEKIIEAKFTEPEFFRTIAPQTQMSFFFDPNLIKNGYYNKTKKLLSDFIAEMEEEFYEKHQPLFANHLYASDSVMDKLESCYNLSGNERLGMDLYEGRINIEENIEADERVDEQTVFALQSNIKGSELKPLYLVRDNSLRDDVIVLKYI